MANDGTVDQQQLQDTINEMYQLVKQVVRTSISAIDVGDGQQLAELAIYNTLESAINAGQLGDAGNVRKSLGIGDLISRRIAQGIEVIAHRGFRDTSIQNTLLSLTTCRANGADSLEFDVQVTSDGVPVIYHDDDLGSLTTGSGTIASQTLAAVQSVYLKQAQGTPYENGVRVPTLQSVLAYVQKVQCRFYPEIKKYRDNSDIATMVGMVQVAQLSSLCCWQSFSAEDLQRVRTLDAQCELGFLSSSGDITVLESLADIAASLLPASLLIKHSQIVANPEIIEYARSRGVDIGAWTIDTKEQRDALTQLGIVRLMCDRYVGEPNA